MRCFNIPNNRNPLGERPSHRRQRGAKQFAMKHPRGLTGIREDLLEKLKLESVRTGNQDLSKVLFNSLFKAACNSKDNEYLPLIVLMRYEALRLHKQRIEIKQKHRFQNGITSDKRLQRKASTQNSEYAIIASWCKSIEISYSFIKSVAHNRRFQNSPTYRSHVDQLRDACTRITVPLNGAPITIETNQKITVRRRNDVENYEIGGGGGGTPPSLYDFIVKLIKDVKSILLPTRPYKEACDFVRGFVKNLRQHQENEKHMHFYNDCVEANRLCEDLARKKLKKETLKEKEKDRRSYDDIIDAIWETCYRKTIRGKEQPGTKKYVGPPGPVPILDKSVTNGFDKTS